VPRGSGSLFFGAINFPAREFVPPDYLIATIISFASMRVICVTMSVARRRIRLKARTRPNNEGGDMIFKRKNGEAPALAQLEPELARSRERRGRLQAQLVEAQAALDQAIGARRRQLVEDDADTGSEGKDAVLHAREQVDALSDAIEQLDGRIQHLESRIGQERDQLTRAEASRELIEHANALGRAVEGFTAAAKMLIERAPPVIDRCPPGYSLLPVAVGNLVGQIITEMTSVLALARHQAAAIVNGDAAIRIPPPAIELPKPAPQVARASVLLYGDVKWREPNGELCTAPRMGLWSRPAATAERAIRAGWAVPSDAPIVQRLRDADAGVGQSWAPPPAHACTDLDAPEIKRPPPGSFGHQPLGAPPDAAEATIGEER
jgi:hypothetical protein